MYDNWTGSIALNPLCFPQNSDQKWPEYPPIAETIGLEIYLNGRLAVSSAVESSQRPARGGWWTQELCSMLEVWEGQTITLRLNRTHTAWAGGWAFGGAKLISI